MAQQDKNPPRQKWRSVITSCRERGPLHCINATLLHNAYTVLAKGGGIFWTSRSPKPPREWGNFTISHIVVESFKLDVSNQHLPNMASPWGQPRSTWLRLGRHVSLNLRHPGPKSKPRKRSVTAGLCFFFCK